MSSPLDEFYKNFPLTFVDCNLSEQHLAKLPSCINEARDQILHRSWNRPDSEEAEIGNCIAKHIYLHATGNFGYEENINNDPNQSINELIAAHRISETSCGLVSDIDISQRSELIRLNSVPEIKEKIDDFDFKNNSFHEILRFCYSHGMYVGHDIEIEELKSMARWILQNEFDGVTFDHFSTLMQQSIDMSVLAQYAAKMGPDHDEESKNRLNNLTDKALSITLQMEKQNSIIQHEAGLLLNASNEAVERKPISDFQAKVLHSHIQSQMQIEDKIEKGAQVHTSSSSNSQLASQNQDDAAVNSNDNS